MKKQHEIKTIGEVCDVIAGQSPPSSTYNFEGRGLPFFQGKADFGTLYPTARVWCDEPSKIALPNDILISVRAPVGPTNVCQTEACIGRGLSAIRAKNGTDFKYVLYFLRFIEPHLSTQGRGSTFSAITQSEIRNLEIPLPPLPIQKQIAAILQKADAAREKRRQANQLTEQFLQSAFLEMFGDPVKSSIVKKRVLVGDILGSYQYGLSVALSGDSSPSDGLPVLRIANITGQGYIDYSDLKYFKVGKKREESLRLKKGDLLFNWRNSPKWVGKTAIFNGEGDFIFASFLLRLRIREEIVNKVFFWYWVNYLRAKGVFESKCRQAVNQASFNGFDLERIEMICPPLPEQEKFAALVEKVESLRAKQLASANELENLFSSLMQRAFRGELVQSALGPYSS